MITENRFSAVAKHHEARVPLREKLNYEFQRVIPITPKMQKVLGKSKKQSCFFVGLNIDRNLWGRRLGSFKVFLVGKKNGRRIQTQIWDPKKAEALRKLCTA